MKKYQNVKDLFDAKGNRRPLTTQEVLLLVERARGTIFRQLKSLCKHNLLEKIEIQIDGSGGMLVVYRWKKNEEDNDEN